MLLRRCAFGPAQLAALPSLKCVLRMGAGYDNIDTDACASAGVVACNCPDAWTEEVADSALSLTLAIIRRSVQLSAFVSSGAGWTRQAALPRKGIRRIRGAHLRSGASSHSTRHPCVCSRCNLHYAGLRLGLVGLGRIGTAVAQRARAFGFEVAFYDPERPAGTEKGLGGLGRHDSFEALLATSDVVSFHCPLTSESSNLLSRAALESLDAQRGLYVVNTARGGVLDEAALLEVCGVLGAR